MTRTTPELTSPLQTSAKYNTKLVLYFYLTLYVRINVQQAHIHDGYSVESCLEPGSLLLQGRRLTTRPPRPHHLIRRNVGLPSIPVDFPSLTDELKG
ncbi:hypothetical protein AVEN_47698-1 [Araneus ventricosus]|uniref:Uncharacterized protein n=1 Tax=Araneus ventricosus TaxID=182803 RepID=A0A4Y2IMU7_ARAVE|nr:hypothetical protein AVEN_47698-1 [Araneus ventricosus]